MIIEAFGPSGAGKTTFCRALAQRLRDRGHTVELEFTLPRRETGWLNSGGLVPALLRVAQATMLTLAVLCRPIKNARPLRLALGLLRLMPPRNPVWLIRLAQYIIRLSCVWKDSHRLDRIVVFDQGFVQAVCTLALFSGADEATIAEAVSMLDWSDLLIRFDAPVELLEQRLHQRKRQTSFAERWFEPDVSTYLEAKPIVDHVSTLLARTDQTVVCVNSSDPRLVSNALDIIEAEVSAWFAKNGSTSSRHSPARGDKTSPDEGFTQHLSTPNNI